MGAGGSYGLSEPTSNLAFLSSLYLSLGAETSQENILLLRSDAEDIKLLAALFIIARTWKQPRCLSADEWISKLWYIYTGKD